MRQFLFLIGLLNLHFFVQCQPFNNEWIDYNKTYYKFKVGETGVYRISQTSLSSIGLGNTSAENFQLWRNGQQLPIYVSTTFGPLANDGFIEFWGEKNDGLLDKYLYRDITFQLSTAHSLQTDTASFFLTVNTTGGNLRIQNIINNVSGNTLSPDAYFMHTEGNYFKHHIHPGYFVDAGQRVYSSSYDKGEGWSSYDIYAGQSLTNTHQLYLYNNGPTATFKMNIVGNALNLRRFRIKINSDSIGGQQLDYLEMAKVVIPNISLSIMSAGAATIEIKNQSTVVNDRMQVAQYELTYPRVFNFGQTKNFEFSLASSSVGNYLEINNFNYGATAPILYDFTNQKRYVGDISNPAIVRFALTPSTSVRKLVLFNIEASNIFSVNNFTARNFKNFSSPTNQGDYLIISHPSLFTTTSGTNPVEQFGAYRASTAGGSFNTKIFEIDELVDQFAFGIKKHPLSIRNFLRFSRTNFTTIPKFVFLIGHGVVYDQYRMNESNTSIEKLNIIPTFGWPASDVLLSAESTVSIPITPIGRLSVINGNEVAAYLNKVQQYEGAQQFSSPFIQDKAWMKTVMHMVGASDPFLQNQLNFYMTGFKQIIADTLFGANVQTFSKISTESTPQITNLQLQQLFTNGVSQLTYFGHSSATILDFNLENPEAYNNQGKYPFFIVMGCSAGDFFNFSPARFFVKETLSEKFVLAEERGSIAFLASSHVGLVNYLDLYNKKTYDAESITHYGKSFGEIIKAAITQVLFQTGLNDFLARILTEQNTFHGDPAIKPNTQNKPDYVIEDPQIKISPTFISVAEANFKVNAKLMNLGKAVNKEIAIEVKRQLPNGTILSVFKDTISGIRFIDSLEVSIPINPITDKGLNKITVSIDVDNKVDEMYESNNSITKDVFIYEDEARPIFPLEFAIINRQNIKLLASTANPFSPLKQYRMEIDTTELYNSILKRTQTISSIGGLLEFSPGFLFSDSTVYYWRIAPLDASGNPTKWNSVSFVYLSNSDLGFNQSHFFQHTKSPTQRLRLDSSTRSWKYFPIVNNLFLRTTTNPTGGTFDSEFSIMVNGVVMIKKVCLRNSLLFNVFNSVSFKPWQNVDANGNSLFLYGSASTSCSPYSKYNFEFSYLTPSSRKLIMDFMDTIPNGSYVTIRTSDYDVINSFAATWKGDTLIYGSNNSLYHKLRSVGFAEIDSINRPRVWVLIYKKASTGFIPQYKFSQGIYDRINLSVDCITTDSVGYLFSPIFGAAKQWKQLKWRGTTDVSPGDNPTIDVIGITSNGSETVLMNAIQFSQQDVDLSSINAAQYPYIKLKMRNIDSVHFTPYLLRHWRITYVPVPEGAIAPNLFFQFKDTLEVGEPLLYKMAFKNISEANFDSLKVKLQVINNSNVSTTYSLSKFKTLQAWDTMHVRYTLPTASLPGSNMFFNDINPDNDQPEQSHFNNFIYKNFYVKPDKTNPLLDVTFDGVHILNRDIVSAKTKIVIKIKDEAKWMILNDTTAVTIRVYFPDGSIRSYYFKNGDTLKFTPAGNAPNNDNTASIDFSPIFLLDGDYELVVSGKDRSGNGAGNLDYKVGFQVINKAMISNMLNYPNPFTTSTAFVFTLTGSELPQNIRIQILTITGKIVKEISKEELGILRIGRNITDYKWDGTDQYGQKLANGIYLYRVITNSRGKSLEKYKSIDNNTDRFFNNGYGKMYLMR